MLKSKGKTIEEMVTPTKLTESKLEVTHQARQSVLVEAGFREEPTQRKSRLTEHPEDTYKMGRNCLRDQPRPTKKQKHREELKEEQKQKEERQREERQREERLAQMAKTIHERRLKRSRSLTPSSLKAIELSRRADPVAQLNLKPIGRKSIDPKKRCTTIPKISLSLKSKLQKEGERSPTSSLLQSQILHMMKPEYEERPCKSASKVSSNEFIRIEEASEVENSYYADHHHPNTDRLATGSSISHKLECIIRKNPHLQ